MKLLRRFALRSPMREVTRAGVSDYRLPMTKLLAFLALSTALATPALATSIPAPAAFDDASTNLPARDPALRAMDGAAGDIDGDGDLDLIVAMEFSPNRALINDGTGKFTDESDARLPRSAWDSEEAALADFDGDGDLDIVIVCEDDARKSLFLNDGKGVFADASDRFPQTGISNGVEAGDYDGDGDPDLAIANAWTDFLWINDGKADFTDESGARLPRDTDTSQDFSAADLDGDGDLDLVSGGETGNRLLMNDGQGIFTDATANLPAPPTGEVTRKAALGDADGDGDIDMFFANMVWRDGQWTPNRLLLNDGAAKFTDVTATNLPAQTEPANSIHGAFHDLDGDGDRDILIGTITSAQEAGTAPTTAWLNDGKGLFAEVSGLFPDAAKGNTMDSVEADFNGDGKTDLFLANRIGPDVLLMRN
jgi:hypothetical protein